jgi:Tol biopolymer transport system component
MAGVHPTREGYRQMALSWLQTLEPYFQLKNKKSKPVAIQRKTLEEKLEGRVVFQSNRDGNFEIYRMDATGNNVIRLTDNPADDEFPVWSPDGSKIAFKSDRDGDYELYVMDGDGKNVVQVTRNDYIDENARWTPDGQYLVFHSERDDGWEIYTIKIDGTGLTQITNTRGKNNHPAWSPRNDLIAFTGNRYLGWGVYSMNPDGTDMKTLAAGGGACRPVWSRNGSKLAFVCAKKDDKGDIWIMNPDGSNQRCVTIARPETYDYFPTWSRDNSVIMFASAIKKKSNTWELWVVTRDGKQYKQLTNNEFTDSYPNWY